MIIRARLVVTMDGAPIQNGWVRVVGNRISEFGEITQLIEGDDELIDLGNSVLLPGLINAHCHLDYTCLRGKIERGRSFADWIRAINSEKTRLSEDDYLRSITEGFSEAQRFGTTSIVNLESFPELVSRFQSPPLRTWWCAELIDVTAPERADEILADAVANLKSASESCWNRFGLAPHAPFTASANLYRACAELARRENFVLTTHLAESDEELEMFLQRSGRLFNFLTSIGRRSEDCNGRTPLAILWENLKDIEELRPRRGNGPAGGRWILAHANQLELSDVNLLSKLAEKFSIVHCPRSHAYFGHRPFAFEQLDALGLNICLGTDSLASNQDLSLFREMREFSRGRPELPPRKVLEMVTVNPAEALGVADRLGKILPDYEADMIAIPCSASEAYASIEEFDGEVPWAMIGGKVVKFSRFPLFFSQT